MTVVVLLQNKVILSVTVFHHEWKQKLVNDLAALVLVKTTIDAHKLCLSGDGGASPYRH